MTVHVGVNIMTLKKINILEYALGRGLIKEYSLYAFINVDNCEQPLRTIQISRENNIIHIYLPDGSTSALPLACLHGRCLGYQRRLAELFLIKIIKWTVKLVLK